MSYDFLPHIPLQARPRPADCAEWQSPIPIGL